MPFLLFQYFNCFFISIIGISLIGSIPAFFLPGIKNGKISFTSLFLSYVFGLIIITSLVAIFKTNGVTIFSIIILCFVYFMFCIVRSDKSIKLDWRYSIFHILGIITILVMVSFFLKSLPYLDFSNFEIISPHNDYIIYSINANAMAITGQENTYAVANFLFPDHTGASPYHYTELWLSILCADIFSISYLSALLFIVFPVFLFGWLLALLSIWEIFGNVKVSWFWLVFLLLFISGVHFDFFYKIDFFSVSGVFGRNLITELGDKYGYVYMLIALSILIWHYYGNFSACIIILIIPLSFAATVPGVFGAFPIVVFLFRRNIPNYLKLLMLWFIVMASFIVFYMIFNSGFGQSNDLNIDIINSISKFNKWSNFKISINVILGTSIQLLIIYFPIFLIVYLLNGKQLFKDQMNIIAAFSFFTYVFGLLMWALVFEAMDMVQLVNGCSILFINTYSTYLIIKGASRDWRKFSLGKRIFLLGTISIFICIQLMSSNFTNIYKSRSPHGTSYKRIISKLFATKKSSGKVYIANVSNKIYHHFDLLSYHRHSTDFIFLEHQNLFPICLDDFEKPIPNTLEFHLQNDTLIRKSGFFYKFVAHEKSEGAFHSLENSRIAALDSLKINFIAINESVVPTALLLSKFKLVAKDSISGESFYIRKNLVN